MPKIIIYQCLIIFTFSNASLIKPQNGAIIKYTHVLFEWEQVAGALSYNLQVSDPDLFDNLILDINEETTIYIEKNSLEWGNNYFWRLKSIFSNDTESNWSEVYYFQIDENLQWCRLLIINLSTTKGLFYRLKKFISNTQTQMYNVAPSLELQ